MGSYFTILWEINPEHLMLLTERFELPHYQSLYTYSSAIFQKIIKQTKITQAIIKFGENIAFQGQGAQF